MTDHSALLVIDMANDFVFPGGVIADAGGGDYQRRAQAIIPNLARLLEAAREAEIPVIYSWTGLATPAPASERISNCPSFPLTLAK